MNVVVFICCNYLIRKGCEAVSLFSLSAGSLREHFTNVWTIFDTLTILLVLFTMMWKENHPNEYHGGWNAVVIGMLWIRVLTYLKVVNQQMALFVAALGQILVDLRFFAVVLVVCVFMFGDMMQIVITSKDDGRFCENHYIEGETGAIQDFCSGSRSAALLRV